MHADVIVVGAGLAGMTAALAAEHMGVDVILVDRGPIGTGTNSALSNGVFAGPASLDRMDEYVRLVLQIGKGLNRVEYVRQVARDALDAMAFMASQGVSVVKLPGQWAVRSPRPEVIPGLTLVRGVAQQVLSRKGIRVERGVCILALALDGNRVAGVHGIDLSGAEWDASAHAVVLACGGAGAIYAKNDNQQTILGQGYRLAAQAGLDLWDMEFVQFYPIVLDEPGLPAVMIYPPYPAEARLLTPGGEDLLAKHGLGDINQAIVRKRDAFSALIAEESTAGPVRMDLRTVPAEQWAVHPLSLLARFKFDFRTRPVRITPGTHFFMGGVRTDADGMTATPGLFACGEMVWGLHGANRMGGNALMECLVSGRIAGRSAAGEMVSPGRHPVGPLPAAAGSMESAEDPVDLRVLRERLREVASRYAGIVRSREGMTEGLREADRMWQALQAARALTPRDRILREDLLSAAFTLRAVLTAGLGRLESRGSFCRSDHPAQDDVQWLRNSRSAWDPVADRFCVEYVAAEAL
jgi:succinate dehydrogenase/fumarate reductase flavoprotein subunit